MQYNYITDESVWDFEFDIGIFRPKYRGIGIGFGIKFTTKSLMKQIKHCKKIV